MHDVRIDGTQQRKNIETYPIAQHARVTIAAVLTERQRSRRQEPHDLLPRTVDQRANNAAVAHRLDARHTVPSGATQQPHQQRLGLVVHRVTGRNLRAALGLGDICQEGVALLARPRLEVGLAAQIDGVADDAAHTEHRCHQLRALLIAFRLLTPQVVIEVRRAHLDSERGSEGRECSEQRHRVRPTRYRHQHPLAGRDHCVACDRSADLLQQGGGRASLHSASEFDIIAAALQMSGVQLLHLQRMACWFSGVMLVALTCSPAARGADEKEPPPEEGTSRQEILDSLHALQRKYGSDAVLMQGHLLGQAIRSGSILEAVISVSGVEEHNGKRFLTFKLETGIIYNDREVAPHERSARAWSEIVEVTLRQFHRPSVPADGVAVVVSYTHKPYADLTDLHEHLKENHGEPEAVAFYVLVPDIVDLNADRITPQQLIDRSTVLVNGAPAHLALAPPTPSSN